MPLYIIRNDITKMHVDAIVNAANSTLLGGGGVDGAIHRAAGEKLLLECKKLNKCETGKAKITKGYNLPCKYIIHAVGPVYKDGSHGEKDLLISCYKESLALAKEYNCETVAFPLISSGAYGYPKNEALSVATDVISDFVFKNDITVYLVIFDNEAFKISEKLFSDIKIYIDDNYVESHSESRDIQSRRFYMGEADFPVACKEDISLDLAKEKSTPHRKVEISGKKSNSKKSSEETHFEECTVDSSLKKMLSQIDESFSQMLLRKIDEKGMTDAECYKKANIDRKLFSKIRSDVNYKPSKLTAIAFAISLELSLSETKDLLCKAGFALSHSNKFDIIIEYFIQNKNYNIFEINEALFAFDQNILGS